MMQEQSETKQMSVINAKSSWNHQQLEKQKPKTHQEAANNPPTADQERTKIQLRTNQQPTNEQMKQMTSEQVT